MKKSFKLCFGLIIVALLSFNSLAVPMSGNYTINSLLPTGGTNFISFNNASDSLTANGVSGPVVFLVKQGTYTEQVIIGNITGTSSVNTVLFKADPTNTSVAKIVYNGAISTSTNYVIRFSSANYITIDSLEISSTSGTSYGILIDIIGTNSNITLKNNTLNGSTNKSNSSYFALINKGYGSSNLINHFDIVNNSLNGGSYGIQLYGSSAGRMNYFNITGNSILNSAKRFISAEYCSNLLIANNYCEDDTNRNTTLEGIYVSRSDSSTKIKSNTIHINAPSNYSYGIRVNYLSGTSVNYSVIENNMISMDYATAGQYGIKVENCFYQNIYHNSVKVSSTNANYSIALNVSGNGSTSYGKTNIVNNIFYNAQGGYASYINNYSASYVDSMKNNIYYSSSSTPFKYHSTTYTSLAAYKIATGLDANSLFGDPGFISGSDLHLVGVLADNSGDNTIGVTADIDGNIRPATGSTTVDIGADEYTLVACPSPSLISDIEIRNDSIALSWLNGPSDSAWLVEYGAPGFIPGTGTLINSANDTMGIGSLSASTCYDIYLRSICPLDTSGFVGPFSFCTPCAPISVPYVQDFATMSNTAPPTCWMEGKGFLGVSTRVVEGYSAWTSDDFGNVGTLGTGAARSILGYTNINDWLVSPLIDLGALSATNYQVEFRAAVTGNNNSSAPSGGAIALDDKVVFLISTDYGTTWSNANILRQWDSTDLPVAGGEYFNYNLTAGGYSGVVRFAFYSQSTINNARNEIHIDDFEVRAVPTCPDPSLLMKTANTTTSVSLSWTNGASDVSWILEHGPIGFIPGSGVVTPITTSGSGTITGLMSSSLYDVYLRSICGLADTSRFVGPLKVQTVCAAQINFCEDFTNIVDSTILPVCWSIFNNSTSVNTVIQVDNTASQAFAGNSYLLMSNRTDLSSTLMLISPEVSNLSSGTHRANFWAKENGISGDSSLIIGTMTNPLNPGTFTVLDTIALTSVYSNYKIDFSSYSGSDNYVAFLWDQKSTNDRVYIDEFCWEAVPSCEKAFTPSVLNSGVDSTSLNIGWAIDTSHVSYIVWYGPLGYTPGATTQIGTTTSSSNFVTINSLTPITEYCFWIKSVCTSGDTSDWEGPICGKTACPEKYNLPYFEGYSNYIPNCWTEAQGRLGTTNTTFSSTSSSDWSSLPFGYSGSNLGANIYIYGTNLDEWLISPSLDLGVATGKTQYLEFDFALTETGSSNLGVFGTDDSVVVVISYDNGVTWNNAGIVGQWDATSTIPVGVNHFSYTIRNKTGKIKVGLYAASSISNKYLRFHIDNFSLRDTVFVGLDENSIETQFKIYPNPNEGLFTLLNNGKTDKYLIQIIDMQGRIILSDEKIFNSSESRKIDISGYSKGVYFLQLVSENRTEQHKIIVR